MRKLLPLILLLAAASPQDKKPNILLIITDQEREVMHWPAGWAEANLPARSRLLEHGLQFTRPVEFDGGLRPPWRW